MSHLPLQNMSQMCLRGLVVGCLSSWELHPMISDPDLCHVKDLRHHHICPLFIITIRTTKGKLRQREASSKSLLCNHYSFFHPCNDCFHGDQSKPVATSMHSAGSCFHRNTYTGLPETKLLLPSQTHQVTGFSSNKFPSHFVLRWPVAGSLAVAEQLTMILSWVECANPRASQGALLAVGWDYQTKDTIHCTLENISGVIWLVISAARNQY